MVSPEEIDLQKKAVKNDKQIFLTWENLNYTVYVKELNADKKKAIREIKVLKNCAGYAQPGETLFIMGSSGAGKTSLMNALSDRITQNKTSILTGNIQLNKQTKLTQRVFGCCGSYVMQDDILFPYFTVKECMTFAARLKLSCSEEEQDERIEFLIKDLGLERCQNTKVGSVLRKTSSGGERKRTAIGVELVTDPSLILLDEPTSGLDSFTATHICRILSRYARKHGKTIISTIH